MSDVARIAGTLEVVCSADLQAMGEAVVAALSFQCTGCDAPSTPCAYAPGKKVRPYFAVRGRHGSDCEVEGSDVEATGGSAGVASSARESLPTYPATLTLPIARPVAGGAGGNEDSPTRTSSLRDRVPGKRLSRGTATSIRSVCVTYIRYPEWRRIMDLTLPEGNPSKYAFAFKRLSYGRLERCQYPRIFYGELRWKDSIVVEGDRLIVSLHAGGVDERRRLTQPYRVVVDRAGWDAGSSRSVQHDAELALREAREVKAPVSVFFLGRQVDDDLSTFVVSHPRAIAFFGESVPRTPVRVGG